MNTRFKMIAAALGLVIATGAGAGADAFAKTAPTKTMTTKTVTTKTMRAGAPRAVEFARAHRLHLVRHGVTRWSVAHRFAPRGPVAHKVWIKPATKVVVKSRLVGVQKSAMAHRTIVKKTIVR